MSAVRELRRKWTPLDPGADSAGMPDAGTRQSTLESILASVIAAESTRHAGRASRWRPSTRWMLGATAGAAALVVTVAAVGFALHRAAEPVPGALAATPVLLAYELPAGGSGARQKLEKIADGAAASPAPPASELPEHLRIASWSLFTRIDDQQVTSAVVPVDAETWRAADGSGKIVQRYGKPQFRTPAEKRAWSAQGEPGAGAEPATQTFAAGEFTGMWPDRPPTDTAAATVWLRLGHPVANGPAETLVAVNDLARERVLTPAERAAVLRVVAALPGLTYNGVVRDRAGRVGEAFSVDSAYTGLPTRYTLIVSGADGRLLGYEEMLTTTAGKLNVAVPSVINYESYLVADHAPIS